MRFNLPDAKYSQPVQRVNFFEGLLERVRAFPGVEAAGLGRAVPGSGYWGDGGFLVAEHPPLPLGQAQYAITRWADPRYFAALGIPLLRGQTFDANKWLDKDDEFIVNESFPRQSYDDETLLSNHQQHIGHA